MSHPPEVPPPQPVYQTPDWEIPSPQPKRRSILDRVLPSTATAGATKAQEGGAAAPAPLAGASSATLRQRFDALLPPNRTYFGRLTRRALLLLAALALVCLVALVVGLAVGLSRRAASPARENLPLPSNTGGVFTGDLTYYDPGLGACGEVSGDQDLVVSVSHIVFDAAGASAGAGGNPNANPLCGRRIRIRRDTEGRGEQTIDVTVVDRCTGCAPTDLDTTIAVFERVARKDDGRVTASWAWLE